MFFNFRSQQDLDETLSLDEILTRADKVKDVEFSTERSVEKYFSREKVRQMLTMITVEPASDASRDRGHAMPFHTDMIFGFNKACINAKFFQPEKQDEDDRLKGSIEKKTSPQQMIDVFMTPQSEDEFSEESMSPNDETSSPTKLSPKLPSSPPVGSFVENCDVKKDTVVLRDETLPTLQAAAESEESKEEAQSDQMKDEVKEDAVPEVKSQEKAEEVKDSEKTNESEAQKKPSEQDVTDPASNEIKVDVVDQVEEQKVAGKDDSDDEVQVFSDQVTPEKKPENSKEENQQDSTEKLASYLEESKDSDVMRISYDDDEDGETICEIETLRSESSEGQKQLHSEEKKSETLPLMSGESSNVSIELNGLTGSSEPQPHQNRYELFELYLSFLDIEKDESGETKLLNPVLLGYWCNLFRSLVQTHPQEVFLYVYQHQSVLEKMVEHLYSPQMSDIFVRLLNFNKSVFTRVSSQSPVSCSEESMRNSTPAATVQSSFSETAAQEIRQFTIFSIIERIGTGFTFDQQKTALQCLIDLPDNVQILSVMTRPSSLESIKSFLKIDDDEVKTNCFKLLQHILSRTFDSPQNNDWQSVSSGFSLSKEATKHDEQELVEFKKSVKAEMFVFMREVVQLVLAFEFQTMPEMPDVASGDRDMSITAVVGQNRKTGSPKKLGMMRLGALELIDKLNSCYGLPMLEVFKEADLFTSLLKLYALHPYNDIAHRYVTNVITFALDHSLAKAQTEKQAPPKRPSRMLDLEPIDPAETEASSSLAAEEVLENEQGRRDNLLIYLLFSTPLTDLIIEMCSKHNKLSYEKTSQTTEMGYVAHLSRLAQLILQIGDKNEIIREQLDDMEEWKKFEENCLRPRIELRTGSLCRGKKFEKQKESRFLSMFDDDEDDGDNQVDVFGRDDDYGGGFEDQRTNQDEMDQLLQPCLDYDDNDDENTGGLLQPKLGSNLDKDQDEEEEPEQYNIEKYFSNGDVNHTDRIQAVFSKRHGKSGKPRRYGDDNEDEEDEDENYGGKRGQNQNSDSDEDELDRGGDPLSLEELDGWMNQINKDAREEFTVREANRKQKEEQEEEISPNQEEVDFLRQELSAQDDSDESPFKNGIDPSQELEEDEDDEDELALDFITQVQMERTSLRNILDQPQLTAPKPVIEEDKDRSKDEFLQNNYWKLPIESDEYALDDLLADYK